jgi:flagella basal body P-ring formation protein FlgA
LARPARAASPKPAVRAGDRTTAVFLSNRLRLTARVTCLERGREGEVIRVRSQDGHIFRARISGPAQLEALPQQ